MKTITEENKSALVIHEEDNVAVALADLKTGDKCIARLGEKISVILVKEDISFGHKIALKPIGENESVLKYGEEIGKLNRPVDRGCWIHNHNMFCERGRK
jgi:altronate dehydratase small subunit